MHGHIAVHVGSDMNSTTIPRPLDAHEKTIDLRIERLHTAISHADALYADSIVNIVHTNRAITVLIENRGFVSAHAHALIDQIVAALPADEQDEQISAHVRPLTLLVERANVALARMRYRLPGADL